MDDPLVVETLTEMRAEILDRIAASEAPVRHVQVPTDLAHRRASLRLSERKGDLFVAATLPRNRALPPCPEAARMLALPVHQFEGSRPRPTMARDVPNDRSTMTNGAHAPVHIEVDDASVALIVLDVVETPIMLRHVEAYIVDASAWREV